MHVCVQESPELPFSVASECELFMHAISQGVSQCVAAASKRLHVSAIKSRKSNNDSVTVAQSADGASSGIDDDNDGSDGSST